MKGKVLVGYDTGDLQFVDCDFDETKIYMKYYTLDNVEDSSIQVHLGGESFTIKRNKELLDYLYKKFNKQS
jgi:hypothetical protein